MKGKEKEDLIDYLDANPIPNSVSVTLTAKQCADGEILDQERLEENIKRFLKILNRQIFGNAHNRFGKRVRVMSVIEGGTFFVPRLHAHLAIERPSRVPFFLFREQILDAWIKTRFGYRINKVEPAYPGWIEYSLKEESKRNGVLPAVDWTNTDTVERSFLRQPINEQTRNRSLVWSTAP